MNKSNKRKKIEPAVEEENKRFSLSKMKKQVLVAGIVFLVLSSAIVVTLVFNQNSIQYEKRALIFHANILDGEIITKEDHVDIYDLYDQLPKLGYKTDWYYLNDGDNVNILKILEKQSKRSEQLILVFIGHGGMYEDQYNQLLGGWYSSKALMDAVDHTTKTFIYSFGCGSGRFAEGYDLPTNWIVHTSVKYDSDSGYINCFDDDWEGADIHFPSIEGFNAGIEEKADVESAWNYTVDYMRQYYNGTYFFEWNAPTLTDGNPTELWIL